MIHELNTYPSCDAEAFDREEELRQLDAEIQLQVSILELLQNGANKVSIEGLSPAIVNVARLYRTIERLTKISGSLMEGS